MIATYKRAFAIGMQNALEYRMDFALNMVAAVFPIFIQLFMWSAIYGKTGQGAMFGYTYPQMIAYTVLAGILNRLLRTGFEYEISQDIKTGGLNKYIIRPVYHFPFQLALFLGSKSVQTGLMSLIVFVSTFFVARATGLPIGAAQVAGFLPAFALAFVLNFLLYYLMSAIAFWLAEIGFFFEAVRIVFIALSGGVFPIDVLGERVAAALRWMPFQYTINFPVDVLNGRIAGEGLFQGIAVQLIWIGLLAGLAAWVWKVGAKKYVAVGG
jgi:ABC-2 type transport system permease protein